ncbi:hypothetical protein Taro_030918 [Colocasia esculenta]|uniref:Uncharacterized protein n=1 Tax=Colocasia esculenta TaxID=4460 RepID=A0A843W1L6_COLES|nr:hypothetical protein [Colocasia esculenta]
MFIDHQPIGEEASKLAEVPGLYARNDNYFQPYKEWREQSKQCMNDVEYNLVDEEGMPANMAVVTKFCEYSISKKVKEWPATLKKVGYMKGINGELSETPPDEREKVIATCEEKNLTNSSEPSVLTPILDDVYNGHHGGYERGRGLGWSRATWSHNMMNEASIVNIRQLTGELENTQSELQNAMSEIQGWRLQVAGWNITLSSHKLIAFSSPKLT